MGSLMDHASDNDLDADLNSQVSVIGSMDESKTNFSFHIEL